MTIQYPQTLLHHSVEFSARRVPQRNALKWRKNNLVYAQLWRHIEELSASLLHFGLGKFDRVAIYLPKQFETVISFFACSHAGLIFVPVNPILKREQVAHILRDSGAKILITSSARLRSLEPILQQCHELQNIIVSDEVKGQLTAATAFAITSWQALPRSTVAPHPVIDIDPVAIFYTSGSTGLAKGVLLSHRNMVCGAVSVASYLHNSENDKLLALLPFSFDYGFSQLSTAMLVGAELCLMDYLLPSDVIKILDAEQITGLAAVPSLWMQLSRLSLNDNIRRQLRYITNSGGAMPLPCLQSLQAALPDTRIYLMYGLTEAFRSTFLDPDLLEQHPTSIGNAIPNAEILVLREDGSECDVDEPGELVHRGSLVALGYWNDPDLTAQRFRSIPPRLHGNPLPEIAVWSGDSVKKDRLGLLYFIGRRDEMIKTSGYRVSPGEIELLMHREFPQHEFAAFAIPDAELGQAIVVAIAGEGEIREQVKTRMSELLPSYMQARHLLQLDKLPLNSNNKIDRKGLSRQYQNLETDNAT